MKNVLIGLVFGVAFTAGLEAAKAEWDYLDAGRFRDLLQLQARQAKALETIAGKCK